MGSWTVHGIVNRPSATYLPDSLPFGNSSGVTGYPAQTPKTTTAGERELQLVSVTPVRKTCGHCIRFGSGKT
jgi:hypothetical protein